MTRKEAEERLADMGPSSLETHKGSTPFGLFLKQLKIPIALVLLAVTIISALVHDWAEAFIILNIILGSAIHILP
jgi:magnesium-transporting ATPase (P-type)